MSDGKSSDLLLDTTAPLVANVTALVAAAVARATFDLGAAPALLLCAPSVYAYVDLIGALRTGSLAERCRSMPRCRAVI